MTVRFIQGHYCFWKLSFATSRPLVYGNNVIYSSEHPLARRRNCKKSQTVFRQKIMATFVTYIAPYKTNPMSRSSRQHFYFVFERTRIHISARKPDNRWEFSLFFLLLYANVPPPPRATAPIGPGFPHSRNFQFTHNDASQSEGLLLTSDWSARRRDLYLTTHDTHNWQTSMPPVGFETTISGGERLQTARPLWPAKFRYSTSK